MSVCKKRVDFRFRLQATVGTPDEVVASYLSSKKAREANSLILQVLRMSLLPLAYRDKGGVAPDQLRVIALEAIDALEKHASFLRQMFRLEKPQPYLVTPMMPNGFKEYQKPEKQPVSETPQQKDAFYVEGTGSQEDCDAVFGAFS